MQKRKNKRSRICRVIIGYLDVGTSFLRGVQMSSVGIKVGKAIGYVSSLLFLFLLVSILMIVLLFAVPIRVFYAFLGLYLVVALWWSFVFIRNKKFIRVMLIVSGVATLSVGCAIGGCYGYEAYYDSIRIIDNSAINTDEYLPFREDSKIARLDHEAKLRFNALEELPRVDGAAALFPMYSAFVNATYPSTIPSLNNENGCFFYTNTVMSNRLLYEGERDLIFGVDAKPYAFDDHSPNEIYQLPMGREGFVFFTNVKNPVNSLTQEQIRDMYTGRIKRWSEVGGNNDPVKPYQRNYDSGSAQAMRDFMKGEPMVEGPEGEESYVIGGMGGIIKVVADYHNHPGAIGYSYHCYATQLKANNNIKILAVDGIDPNLETIGNNKYPLTYSFFMNARADHITPNTRRLMDWVLSDEGQELVVKSGYAPVQ